MNNNYYFTTNQYKNQLVYSTLSLFPTLNKLIPSRDYTEGFEQAQNRYQKRKKTISVKKKGVKIDESL